MKGKRYFNEIKKINMPTSIICKAAQLFSYKITKSTKFSTQSWWIWSLAVTGLPLRVLSLKSACPQFSTFEPPYPASCCTHINTLITINGMHLSVNFNWRNFFRGSDVRFKRHTVWTECLKTLPFWCAMGEDCKHLCVQGDVWWKRGTMRLYRTDFIQICLM